MSGRPSGVDYVLTKPGRGSWEPGDAPQTKIMGPSLGDDRTLAVRRGGLREISFEGRILADVQILSIKDEVPKY